MLSTKRFLYNVIKENIIPEYEERFKYEQGFCHAIIGARKIGKTILFQQLSADIQNSEYLDVSCIKDMNFEDYYDSLLEKGIKVVFLDEVCKLSEDIIPEFIHYTKFYSSELKIFITGSVASLVEELCIDICRGIIIDLPPIMYIERLCWNSGINEINIQSIKDLTSYNEFIKYIEGNRISENEMKEYISCVVEDTLESYTRHTSIEDNKIDISEDKFMQALKYIALAQFVYKIKEGTYVSIPKASKELREFVKENYKEYKSKWDLTNDDIKYVLSVVSRCNLAKKTSIYRGTALSSENLELEDNLVKTVIFEFPWLTSICFSEYKILDDSIVNMWEQNEVLLKCHYLYAYVDKLRDANNDEIDVIYMTDKGIFYGIEVKNGRLVNLDDSYVKHYREVASKKGLGEITFTSTEDENGSIRIDKLVASLEMEYINKAVKGYIDCPINAGMLYERYFVNDPTQNGVSFNNTWKKVKL